MVNNLITVLMQANSIQTNHTVVGSQISHLVTLIPAYLCHSLCMYYKATFWEIRFDPGWAGTWLRPLKEGRITCSQILPHYFSLREHYNTSDTVITSTFCGSPCSVYLTNWVLWFALACCCLPCTHPHMRPRWVQRSALWLKAAVCLSVSLDLEYRLIHHCKTFWRQRIHTGTGLCSLH